MLTQHLLDGLVVGGIYALFALGMTLVFGVHHVLNLAHSALLMWGGMAGLFVVTVLHLPFPMALLCGALCGGLLGVALDYVAFRPLRARTDEFGPLVSSIGANLLLLNIAQQLTDARIMGYPFGTFPVQFFRYPGLRISLLQVTILGLTALVVVLMAVYLRTSFGRQMRAVALSEQTASLVGINPQSVYLQTFFISGALAGAAGVLIGLAFNSVSFLMGEPILLKAFVVIILGGLGSIQGAVVAGLLLGIIQTLAVSYLSSELGDMVLFTALFAILLVKPTGFFPGMRRDARVVRQ